MEEKLCAAIIVAYLLMVKNMRSADEEYVMHDKICGFMVIVFL